MHGFAVATMTQKMHVYDIVLSQSVQKTTEEREGGRFLPLPVAMKTGLSHRQV